MKEINKRDIILIVAIILIVLAVAVIIIMPKNNIGNNESNTQNNYNDILANSPASPEEILSRPVIDTPLNVEIP